MGVPTWIRVAWLLDLHVEKTQRKQQHLLSKAGQYRAEGWCAGLAFPQEQLSFHSRQQLGPCPPSLRWFLACADLLASVGLCSLCQHLGTLISGLAVCASVW